ncbi:MAG TPA: hypothetical protein VJW76_10760 [Verrucomicrobiae bacterium]|nr:hypothetical protein [Verrucomicrobiae bacterium]
MRGFRKKIVLITAFVGVALLIVFVVMVTERTQSVRLSNGTELSFVAMTRGPTNMCFPGGLWERLKYRLLPAKGIGSGRFHIAPVAPLVDVAHYVEDGRLAFPNKAVVWIRHRGGTNAAPLPVEEGKTFYDLRATIADEKGEEWEMRPTEMPVRTSSQNILNDISRWRFPAFPRRGRVLTFRIYARNSSDQWDTLAEFKMRNPTPGPYPVWQPMTLPATRTSGDLEVSLVELLSGIKTIQWLPGQRPFTTARFKVEHNGRPTEAWLPDRMEATDATGNEAEFPIINYAATNGVISYDAQGTSLSPSEVWRLRMRFLRQKDFAPDQMWTSPDLPVGNGVLLPANLTTNFRSGQLTVKCSAGNTIDLKLMPQPKDARVRLVGIVDNRGNKVEHTSGGFGDYSFNAQWKIPPSSESIRITIGLAEMRHFEFLALPARQ